MNCFKFRKAFVVHLHKRLFEQIIECSDVGIDPEIEHELENLKANGLQNGEEEDKSEYVIKVKKDWKLIALNLFKR